MHSSPIDLLASAPKPHKAVPKESEPDGRFSELLRSPTEAEPKRSESGPAHKPTPAAPAEAPSEAGTETAVESEHPVASGIDADPTVPELPAPDKTVITSPIALPEAITWAQPQGGATVAAASAGPTSGTPPAQTPMPADTTATPSATPAAPANASFGMPRPAQVQNPAGAAPPAGGPVQPGPTAPAIPGTTTAAPLSLAPAATTQPVVATAAPLAAAGKTAAGSAIPGEAPRAPAAVQGDTAGAATADAAPAGRPATAPTTAPDRLASAQVPNSDQGAARPSATTPAPDDPGALKGTMGQSAAPESKTGAYLKGVVTSTPAANTIAAPAASHGADKPTAATTAGIPTTVAETADAAAPAGQTDPAAPNTGSIGRLTATAASSSNLAHTPTTAQPAAEQVVLQVQRAVRDGVDRLTMQLKPASLGRIDIQMEVGFDGRLQAVISAERPETLHLLQRDARALAESLNDAGLQADSGSLSFNLRGQSGDHGGGSQQTSDGTEAARSTADDPGTATTEITLTLGDGRVDIKV